MKKIFQRQKMKKLFAYRSRKVMKRRIRQNKKKTPKEKKTRYQTRKVLIPSTKSNKKEIRTEIVAPQHFSIMENTEETLMFFEEFRRKMLSGRKIYVDLSKVSRITADSIMYFLALFDLSNEKKKSINVLGNAPKNQEAKDFFIKSGFYSHLNNRKKGNNYFSAKPIENKDDTMFSIRTGQTISGNTPNDMIGFIRRSVSVDSIASRRLYTVILECLGNTIDHAFLNKGSLFSPHWWALAYVEKEDVSQKQKVAIVLLDNGAGIINTIKTKWHDRVFMRTDAYLLESAFTGDDRTRMLLKMRGKGLPKIKDCVKAGYLKNFRVITNKAFFNLSQGSSMQLTEKFHGTLYAWDIAPE